MKKELRNNSNEMFRSASTGKLVEYRCHLCNVWPYLLLQGLCRKSSLHSRGQPQNYKCRMYSTLSCTDSESLFDFFYVAASRMESSGFPMCVHVSDATQKQLGNSMEWITVGTRQIKGA